MRLESRFGEQVRALRNQRALTQDQLAAKSAISVDSIRRIERGELSPSLSTMAKLARGLNLRLRTLFGGLDGEPAGTHLADQLCDYLSGRSPSEIRRAHRVLEAMLAAGPEADTQR